MFDRASQAAGRRAYTANSRYAFMSFDARKVNSKSPLVLSLRRVAALSRLHPSSSVTAAQSVVLGSHFSDPDMRGFFDQSTSLGDRDRTGILSLKLMENPALAPSFGCALRFRMPAPGSEEFLAS